jgi:hypothetical protein
LPPIAIQLLELSAHFFEAAIAIRELLAQRLILAAQFLDLLEEQLNPLV